LNIDFAPTMMDIAGLTTPADMQGRSFLPLLRGERPADWRTSWYYRYYHDPGDHNTRAHYGIRTETHKLIYFWKKDQWECYDLVHDPEELHNLADDPARAELVMKLKTELYRLKKEVQDNDEFAEHQPTTSVASPSPDFGSRKTVFHLKQGDSLPRGKAPRVAGCSFDISAVITDGTDGVLVSQGGQQEGYALYIKDGKPAFATRHGGKQTVVAALAKLPAGEVEISAKLSKDGTITLAIASKTVATGKASGPIENMPNDGLLVGRDENTAVGPYEAPFAYGGKISRVQIQLGD
jgi:hypothetical protein